MNERFRDAVRALVERPEGITLGLCIVHGASDGPGRILAEYYGRTPDSVFGPGGPVDAATPLVSWSVAKSMVHAAIGIASADGLIDLEAPIDLPEWSATPAEAVTLLDLLEMRSGLRFVEDYVDDSVSNCIEMLFGAGAADHAAYAAGLGSEHPPGAVWNYSSGSTNIICRVLGDAIGGGEEAMRAFLSDRLFVPAGMHSARARFDAAGVWVGSSYVDATTRDFARFGELYLRDGLGPNGQRVLPPGWVDHARVQVAHDRPEGVDGGFGYGRHWWSWPRFPNSLAAHGFEGQYVIVEPDRDLVIAHLGVTDAPARPALVALLAAIIDAVPIGSSVRPKP